MTKRDFLMKLEEGLFFLPPSERQERLTFYSEMIDDRMEEGLSEEEAVGAIGDFESILSQSVPDSLPITPVPEADRRIKAKSRTSPLTVLLLILGAPLWLSLLLAFFGIVLSLFAVLWSIVVSLYAVFASLVGSAFGLSLAGIAFLCLGKGPSGIAVIAVGLISAGLSVFFFVLCKAATKGAWLLCQKTAHLIKRLFVRKGNTK